MKTLQKFKARFKDGKLDEKSKVGKEKGIADSIADDLLVDSEHLVEDLEKNQNKGEVKTIEIYEEVKSTKKKTSNKKEEPKKEEPTKEATQEEKSK